MKDHHVPPSHCPHCGRMNNGATEAGPDGAYPEPGDITVCIQCGAAVKFGAQLQLVELEPGEIESLTPAERDQVLRVVGAVALVRRDC
jgi:hypothetical protein